MSLKNNKLTKYVRESYVELRKVVWPNKDTVTKHTIIVIGISIFIGVYFAAADYVLNIALEAII